MSLEALKIVEEVMEQHALNHENIGAAHLAIWLRKVSKEITNRIEEECIEQEDPDECCCFCGESEEGCHGGGGPDGIEAHDFTSWGVEPDFDADKDDGGVFDDEPDGRTHHSS